MKTVIRKDGSVVRVKDRLAEVAVRAGEAKYCPKDKWRKEVRDKAKIEAEKSAEAKDGKGSRRR